MAWRVHLTNQAIQDLHILAGRQPMLVAWMRRDRAQFYDMETGTLLEEKNLPPAPPPTTNAQWRENDDHWQTYLAELNGLDAGVYLPEVRAGQTRIYTTDDGKLRVFQWGTQLSMATDGHEIKLPLKGVDEIASLALDRALGTLALLDTDGKLHIFQQNLPIGTFDVGLSNDQYPDKRLQVVIARGGSNIFITDGWRIVATDISGNITRQIETHYFIGQMACSPGGGMVITSDIETGVLRIYHGETLVPTHQKFAIDLVAQATQVQLLADLPPPDTSLSAIAAHNRGTICFAMAGVVCVTDVHEMDELPRARKLL